MDWKALLLSLKLAGCATAILFCLGLPVAYWLATTRRKWKCIPEALCSLPLVLPPTVLGFYLLVATGPNSSIGALFYDATGRALPFTFPGLVVALVLCNLPFAIRPFTAAFAAVDPRLVEMSWCLGALRARTFARVILPLAWPGILTGVVLAFIHSIGEFGVVLMVGGGIPDVTRTISVSIYDDIQALNYAAAHRSALALTGLSVVVLGFIYAVQRRVLPL
jgi:molybdate transport system permease protein